MEGFVQDLIAAVLTRIATNLMAVERKQQVWKLLFRLDELATAEYTAMFNAELLFRGQMRGEEEKRIAIAQFPRRVRRCSGELERYMSKSMQARAHLGKHFGGSCLVNWTARASCLPRSTN